MANNERLVNLREMVQANLKYERSRPFVCSGSPFDCKIFIVGLNAATELGHAFFPRYWSDASGFRRDVFERDYLSVRKKGGVRPRLEAIARGAEPVPCLETNIYAVPTRKAAELRLEDKDPSVFEVLVKEIRPKAILVHSNEPIAYFERHTRGIDICRDKPVQVEIYGHRTYVLGLPGPLFSRKVRDAEFFGSALRQSVNGRGDR